MRKYYNLEWLSCQYFFWWWYHAEVAYDHKTLLDIKWYNDVSTKHPLSYVTDSIRNNEFETIAILKMNFNSSEKESFKSYIDRKLLWKLYSVFPQIASKLQPIAYYCSLLVRKSHVDSWREVDLDYDWWFIVRPVDLILSDHVQEIKFIHY